MKTSEVQIRQAATEDCEEIAEILLIAFSAFKSGYTNEAFEIVTPSSDEIVKRLDEGPIWIAVRDGEILGTVSTVPEPEWLYIRSLAVRPSAQGLGIGNRLLEVVEEYGIENGFDRLFLYTTYFSTGVVEFYEKNGFVRGRDTTAEEWYGTPGLEMDKKIGRTRNRNVAGS